MDAPKAYSELTSELAWHAMSQIVDGTPLKRVITEIMNATIEWKLADRAGEKEPESNREEYLERNLNDTRESLNHHAEALRQAKQERDTLSAALTASEADVERLNALTSRQDRKIQELEAENNDYSQKLGKANARVLDLEGAMRMARERVKDYEGDNHRLVDENQKLRTGQVVQDHNITKLRKELEQAKQHIQEKANEVMNAYGDVARLELKNKELELKVKVLEGVQARNKELIKERDAAQADADGIKKFNAELHEENNLLRKADESLRLQLEQARSDWKKANESLNEAMNSLSKERKRAEEAEKQRDHHLQVSVERYHEINGLRQAPEVIKREMNDLVQDIAEQRDELQSKYNTCKSALENNERVLNDIIRQRDQARSEWQASQRLIKELEDRVAKSAEKLLYLHTQVHNMNQVLK